MARHDRLGTNAKEKLNKEGRCVSQESTPLPSETRLKWKAVWMAT